MTSVHFGHHTGLPMFAIEMGAFRYFEDRDGPAQQKVRGIIEQIAARELMLKNMPVVDFYRNERGNAVMRAMFPPRSSEVDLGHYMILLQGAWFIFLSNEKDRGTFDRWDPNATPVDPESGPIDPHKGGVDFATLRRQRQSREDRRMR